jgi:hypothetical protein
LRRTAALFDCLVDVGPAHRGLVEDLAYWCQDERASRASPSGEEERWE